jgi:hypothetical protein
MGIVERTPHMHPVGFRNALDAGNTVKIDFGSIGIATFEKQDGGVPAINPGSFPVCYSLSGNNSYAAMLIQPAMTLDQLEKNCEPIGSAISNACQFAKDHMTENERLRLEGENLCNPDLWQLAFSPRARRGFDVSLHRHRL